MVDAPIDEIVELLTRTSPATLNKLSAEYPEQSDLLRPGIIAGDEETRGAVSQRIEVRRKVALIGLEKAVGACARLLPTLNTRLQRANTIALWSQVCATLGSASIFATLAIAQSKVWTYIAALLSLAGSLAALFAQHVRAGLAGGSLLEHYRAIVDAQLEAQETLEQLRIVDDDADAITQLVTAANDICHRVVRAEAML